jgi:hypothetical protein
MLEVDGPQPLLASPGQLPETTEISTDVPQAAAGFRTMPQAAEDFGKVPQPAERRENHTLTVRETARMFETAGVARTERSIINWCQPNRQGITRMDGYYDPNERKYFITPQSVGTAIQEEIQRAKKTTGIPDSESFGNPVEHVKHSLPTGPAKIPDERKVQELERENLDLKITNRAKEIVIERMQKERDGFIEKLLVSSRTVGQLETKLHQLDGPKL